MFEHMVHQTRVTTETIFGQILCGLFCFQFRPSQTSGGGWAYSDDEGHLASLLHWGVLTLTIFMCCLKTHEIRWECVYLFDSADGCNVVGLSAPLIVAVVLAPVRHVPQVLTAPEVLLLVTDPSSTERHE